MKRFQNLGPRLGRFQYLRGKSQFWVEGVRQWILPSGGAAAVANKVFNVSQEWSFAIMLLFPLVVETLGYLWGSFLWRRGGIFEEYSLALQKDPYKIKQIEYQEAAIKFLEQIAASAGRPCWERYAAKDDWATAPNRRPDER